MKTEFMITRQGKQFVLYAGLLDAFHAKQSEFDNARPVLETELIQAPDDSNGGVAIVHASAGFKLLDGTERWVYGPFEGIGDASEENVARNIQPHKIRMAETRAKARALRDLINVTAEVLEDATEDAPPSGAQQVRRGNGQHSREERPEPEASGARRGGAKDARAPEPGKARKSQVDLLKTLAVEWRGEEGVERLEKRIGKPLTDLSHAEADEWIDRLTPEGRE